MKKVVPSQTALLCSVAIAALLTLLPFHALLTVWVGSNIGHYDWVRLWIEFMLAVLSPAVLWLIYRNKDIRRQWRQDVIVWVAAGYGAWNLLVGLWALHQGWVTATAMVTGWIIDLRFIVFLLMCWVVAAYQPWLAARWRELTLLPAAVVTGFGLLQAWLLPADFLRHFGYGPNTIAPFSTVDNKESYVRIQSTLRGPNPLGAYLTVAITALGVVLLRLRRRNWQVAAAFAIAVAAVVLGATYSRSAYIGAVLSGATAMWLLCTSRRARRALLTGAAVTAVLAAGMFAVLRNNDRFQNAFFHTDEHSRSAESSNEVRTSSLGDGLKDVVTHPFGKGPGTAGPASVHNNGQARIAENYYLQVGQETGWLGLALFGALNLAVVWRLWQRRAQQLAVVLLASFVGLSFINMLSHAWADDTLGMLWWGLAGLACSLPAVKKAAA